MYRDELRKDTLQVGDKIGIKYPTRLGWSFFRYPKTIVRTIARITPARTKFVMDDGTEYGKNEAFYKITEQNQHETHVARCAESIERYLNTLESKRREGKIYVPDDEKIIRLCGLLESVVKELS